MGTEKKSGTSGGKVAKLGPYQLHEQVPQSEHGQGDLYRATHEKSGTTALVLKPATGDGAPPLKDWKVSLVSSSSPKYVALEVVDSPWSVAPDKQSVEALVFLLKGVHKGVRRMARAFSGPPKSHEPRLWWRLGLTLAGAAAACVLAFALGHLALMPQPPSNPELLASAPPMPMSHDGGSGAELPDSPFNVWLSDTAPEGQLVLARPLPREPFKGQKRPPCTRYVEVELVGGCWIEHTLKAPCPEKTLFEHQGKCYLPMLNAKPPPQSVEP